jgi:ankyrin repeat protein
LETLLQYGADADEVDDVGNTVLHRAILVCTSTSVAGAVGILLKYKANPSPKNTAGDSPLHMECRK